MFRKDLLFASIDWESDGTNGISVALVVFDFTGKEIATKKRNLHPVKPPLQTTVDWLKSQVMTVQDPVTLEDGTQTKSPTAWDMCQIDKGYPWEVMPELRQWLLDLKKQHKASRLYQICFPSAFDNTVWRNYCLKYVTDPNIEERKRDPFGFGVMDGSTFAMGAMNYDSRENLKSLCAKFLTDEERAEHAKMNHDALADARIQGVLFFKIAASRRAQK